MNSILLPTYNGAREQIQISTIVCVRGSRNYSEFIFSNGKCLLVGQTLAVYESKLEANDLFFRVSKSYIVNLAFIIQFQYNNAGGMVYLKNGNRVSVSRRRVGSFKNHYKSIKKASDAITQPI